MLGIKKLNFFALIIILLSLMFAGFEAKGQENNSDILFKTDLPSFVRSPAKEVLLIVAAANLSENKKIDLQEIKVKNSSGKTIKKLSGKDLPIIPQEKLPKGITPKGLFSKVSSEEEARNKTKILKKIESSLYESKLTLNLSDFVDYLEVGDEVPVSVEGTFQVDNKTTTISEQLGVAYNAALPAFTGWYAGDAHVHTAYSADSILKGILDRANEAKGLNYSWLIITDHAPDLTQETWNLSQNDANNASQTYDVATMVGAELSTMDPTDESTEYADGSRDPHYLAYGLSSYVPNPGYPDGTGSGIETISLVENNNQPTSYGIVAHPYSSEYPWFKIWGDSIFDSKGYGGAEIYNPHLLENTAPALKKWDELLSQGKKVVGTANSDAHYAIINWPIKVDTFGDGMTYLYMPGWDGKDHQAVYDAMKNGRAVASPDGSIGIFNMSTSIDSANIGDTLEVEAGEPITLKISAKGVDDKSLSSVRIISSFGSKSVSLTKNRITGYYNGTFKISKQKRDFPYPIEDGYLRVEFDFSKQGKVTTAYANPIYIKVAKGISFTNLTTDIYPDSDGWYSQAPLITLTNSGSSKIFYKWDDQTAWTTYRAPFKAKIGIHTLAYYADTDPGMATEVFKVGAHTKLTTNISSNELGWYYPNAPEITITNPDAGSIKYKWNDGRWQTYRKPFMAPSGINTLYYQADIDSEIFSKIFKVGHPPMEVPKDIVWRWEAYGFAMAYSEVLNVSPGDKIKTYVSVNKRSDKGNTYFELVSVNDNGEEISMIDSFYTGQTGWTSLQLSGTVPSGASGVRIKLYVVPYNSTFDVDAFGFINYSKNDWIVSQFEGTANPFTLTGLAWEEFAPYEL